MLTALILVCSITLAPTAGKCDRSNAVNVFQVPEDAEHPIRLPGVCLSQGQQFMASLEQGKDFHDDEYAKVVCIRSLQGNVG